MEQFNPSELPGSVTAISKGCTCGADQNNYGEGRHLDTTNDVKVFFYIEASCPLHGKAIKKDKE